ncbi:MAG: radical SAM protein [Spirochaetes bacterium]|nr:radical SAM protein [Spirochaetota bacterium]
MRMPHRNQPLRVALLQLPVQEGDSFYTRANVPLAAGYLAAYQKTHAPDVAEIVIPDIDLQNQAGDAALLQWILQGDFDVVGFTLYLWNRDRSLYLARQIRRTDPECLLVAGGPEVANPRGLAVFHILFQGEGEETFLKVLQNIQEGYTPPLSPEDPPVRFTQDPPLSLDQVPNPYLSGVLPLNSEIPLYVETLRGCSRRCSYCFYGKAYPCVRQFPPDRLPSLFQLASQHRVPEIYLMDPSFNIGGTKQLESRVQLLEQANPTRIPLHTELVLERVTKDLARRMRQVGFQSVEVGLQSINQRALKAVHRPLDPARFQRGARHLQEEGIEVRTGVILGLPEDDLDGFRRTLDFVEALNLQDHLEVYPLSILPGTELWEQAESLGILYMEHPPYWVLATPTFPTEDLYQAIAELEDRYGIEYHRPILPSFSNSGPFCTYLDLRKEAEQKRLLQNPDQISWNLTLSISSGQLGRPMHRKRLLELARHLFRTNPYTYFKIVIHDEDPVNFPILSPLLQQALEQFTTALFLPTHYGNLSRTFVQDPQGRFTVRVFLLTQDPETKRRVDAQGKLEIWESETESR